MGVGVIFNDFKVGMRYFFFIFGLRIVIVLIILIFIFTELFIIICVVRLCLRLVS